jgi:hypothetical protein
MDFFYVFENILVHKAEIMATLGGLGGIYMIVNTMNGKSYIGSSTNIGKRIGQHINGYSSNPYLQNAFNKYGLNCFSLIILAVVPPIRWILLFLEQLALDYIKPAYNLLTIAGSSLGFTHSAETKARMSEAKKGKYDGENNPMYGKVAPTAQVIYVYDLENVIVSQFSSITAAALWLEISRPTLYKYLNSGQVLNGKYYIRNS